MGGVDRADQLRSFHCSGWQSKKWYRYIFWFPFNVSVCNAFVLESEHVGSKRESVYFKLDLTQQLINGFSQQKRKRRSNEVPPNHAVPQDQHVSVRIEGRKRKCVQCIESGRRTAKAGADAGFFLGGVALVSCSTSTPINHKVFFCCWQNTSCIRKPQVIFGGGGCIHPAPSL